MASPNESPQRQLAEILAGFGDLDAAVTAVRLVPAGTPALNVMAAGVIAALLTRRPGDQSLSHLDYLVALADAGPSRPQAWSSLRAVIDAAGSAEGIELDSSVVEAAEALIDMAVDAAMTSALTDDPTGPAAGGEPIPPHRLRYLTADRLATISAQDLVRFPVRSEPNSAVPEVVTPADAIDQGFAGMEGHYDEAVGTIPNDRSSTTGQLLTVASTLLEANRRGEDVSAGLEEMHRLAEKLPPGDRLRTVVHDLIANAAAFTGGTAQASPVSDEDLARMTALAEGTDQPDRRAMGYAQTGMVALAYGQETDTARVDVGVDHMRRAVEATEATHPQHVFLLTGLALALFRRSELTGVRTDRDEAKAVLESARALAGGPHHPQWAFIGEMLAAVRATGGTRETLTQSLHNLRGYLERLLIAPDAVAVDAYARDAADDALDIARASLRDGDLETAMTALEAGRGLAIFAALARGEVVDRLGLLGRSDLADAWFAAGRTGPSPELRAQVMAALTRHDPVGALLDPPSLGQIQRALMAVDADALVYLVPGDDALPGYAVVAPTVGRPGYLTLPALHRDDDLEVDLYLADATRRDFSPAAGGTLPGSDADPKFAKSLDALCDWAWRSAMGPLIEQYLPRLGRGSSGRIPRLILIPSGDLARVPWHAARRGDGAYAVEQVAISQAVSARMLCLSAALPPTPRAPVGLVVGDPDTGGTDLPGARVEAYAIRQSFYRGGRYLGRRPDGSVSPSGAGTAAEVRAWLTATGPTPGSTAHLACVASSRSGTRGRESYLLLAGGERLSGSELALLMGYRMGHPVDLVVLSGSGTGLPTDGHDEAYSLATAFLAGGARSVLATQWAVPDGPTAVLMYLVHHYRQAVGQPVWEALRSAQLWMLDSGRVLPDGMPPLLRDLCATAALDKVFTWANCTHWGA